MSAYIHIDIGLAVIDFIIYLSTNVKTQQFHLSLLGTSYQQLIDTTKVISRDNWLFGHNMSNLMVITIPIMNFIILIETNFSRSFISKEHVLGWWNIHKKIILFFLIC